MEIKPQTIEELRKRHEQLNAQKITAEADYNNAISRLEEFKATALEKWGTDDLVELRRKLAELDADNERKRSEYQSKLDKIEADLEAVNQKFNSSKDKP